MAVLRPRRVLHHGGLRPDALGPSRLGEHSYFAHIEVDDPAELHDTVTSHGVEIVKPLTTEPMKAG